MTRSSIHTRHLPTILQVFVFSNTGQNIAASALGAVATLTTTANSNFASYGNDMYADPQTASSLGWFVNGNCAASGGTPDSWTVR